MVLPNHWRLDYDNVFNYPVSNGFIIAIEGTGEPPPLLWFAQQKRY